MTECPWKPGDRIRNKPGQVWHKSWGTHTVCGRRISEDAEVWPKDEPRGNPISGRTGPTCQLCKDTPVITMSYTSGRVVKGYVQ